jgi:hypothetical protein
MKRERDVAKLKRWCMRRHGEGVPADEICNTAQIPRSTFYDWLRRYSRNSEPNLHLCRCTPVTPMPRRKASRSIATALASAENLRNRIATLPAEVRDATKQLALAILALPIRRRGPRAKLERPRKVVRPPKVGAVAPAEA